MRERLPLKTRILFLSTATFIIFAFSVFFVYGSKKSRVDVPHRLEIVVPENTPELVVIKEKLGRFSCRDEQEKENEKLFPFSFYVVCIPEKKSLQWSLVAYFPRARTYVYDTYDSIQKCRKIRNKFNRNLSKIPPFSICEEI